MKKIIFSTTVVLLLNSCAYTYIKIDMPSNYEIKKMVTNAEQCSEDDTVKPYIDSDVKTDSIKNKL